MKSARLSFGLLMAGATQAQSPPAVDNFVAHLQRQELAEVAKDLRRQPGLAKVLIGKERLSPLLVLLGSGADNKSDEITRAHVEVVRLLLQGGMDANAKTPAGETALDIMVTWNQDDGDAKRAVATSLFRHGGATKKLSDWLFQGVNDQDFITMLLDKGANVNATNRAGGGATLIFYADAEMRKFLLSRGADIKHRSPRGRTLLHHFVHFKTPADIEDAVAKGADVNAQDISGLAPLHLAAATGKGPVVKTLLKLGARKDLRDKKGQTALDLARARKDQALIELLGG